MIDDEFLDRTIKEWQPFTAEQLTREDAREIIENVCDLFDLLNEIGDSKCKINMKAAQEQPNR